MARAISALPTTSPVGSFLGQWPWAISTAMASKTLLPPTQAQPAYPSCWRWHGQFSTPIRFVLGDYADPRSVAVGDFNGDGKTRPRRYRTWKRPRVDLATRVPESNHSCGTTCSQFSSGAAEGLRSVQYDLNNGLINRIVPRNFLSWVALTASAGDNLFRSPRRSRPGTSTACSRALEMGATCLTLTVRLWIAR